MGTGYTKDGYIDVFLQTTQAIYPAGSYVDGTVYINCKGMRNYKSVILKLQGVEHVSWSEGSGKNRRHYTNTKNTYNAGFELAVFANGVIPGGHFAFPFRFILPSELPGSLYESDSCYIRYPLTAELVSADGKNDNQLYTKNLNVLEPSRELSGMIQKQQITNPQCCGCCADYGMVKVTMSCDKNFVRSGDKIHVTGFIDNSGGKQQITNCQISFQDIRWKISSGGAIRKHILTNQPLFVIPEIIQKGQTKQFSFSANIPQGLIHSTAIGSILSRYQVLNLTSAMGCCSNSPGCEFLMVFHTATQQVEVSQKVPTPPGWNPIVANEVLNTNLPPYHYQPTASIPFTNRAGTTNITTLNAMTNQNYYSNTMQANTFTHTAQLY